MKMIIIFAALIAAVLAAPVDDSSDAQVLRYDNHNNGADGFKYRFETSDGIARSEKAHLVDVGTEDEAIEVIGQYSYTGPDNVVYTVTYTAGKAGFVPSGNTSQEMTNKASIFCTVPGPKMDRTILIIENDLDFDK